MSVLANASLASLETIRTIQRFPALCSLLDDLRSEWDACSLIHFDLKAEHLILVPSSGRHGRDLKIIDWETWGPGDPAWDVGSFFGDRLATWLYSVPFLPNVSAERLVELAHLPLERLVPPMHAFWNGYVEALGLTQHEAQQRLLQSIRYSAARLLQDALERMQGAHRLAGEVVRVVQLSWNMLARPEEAADRLLRISF